MYRILQFILQRRTISCVPLSTFFRGILNKICMSYINYFSPFSKFMQKLPSEKKHPWLKPRTIIFLKLIHFNFAITMFNFSAPFRSLSPSIPKGVFSPSPIGLFLQMHSSCKIHKVLYNMTWHYVWNKKLYDNDNNNRIMISYRTSKNEI